MGKTTHFNHRFISEIFTYISRTGWFNNQIRRRLRYAYPYLLYAQSNEHLGNLKQALDEYKVLADYYSGAEAKYCYAKLLQKQGEKDQAKQLFKEIIEYAKLSTRHYRDLNKKWISLAKQEV